MLCLLCNSLSLMFIILFVFQCRHFSCKKCALIIKPKKVLCCKFGHSDTLFKVFLDKIKFLHSKNTVKNEKMLFNAKVKIFIRTK